VSKSFSLSVAGEGVEMKVLDDSQKWSLGRTSNEKKLQVMELFKSEGNF